MEQQWASIIAWGHVENDKHAYEFSLSAEEIEEINKKYPNTVTLKSAEIGGGEGNVPYTIMVFLQDPHLQNLIYDIAVGVFFVEVYPKVKAFFKPKIKAILDQFNGHFTPLADKGKIAPEDEPVAKIEVTKNNAKLSYKISFGDEKSIDEQIDEFCSVLTNFIQPHCDDTNNNFKS